MDVNQYLETVSSQIRCNRARKFVMEELQFHIEEQAECYENQGMEQEEAMRMAVLDMGDPVETGMQMDRIHRPKMEWKLLAIVGMLSVLGIFIQFMIAQYKSEAGIYTGQTGMNQLLSVMIGIVVMMTIYYFDYTIIGKYPRILWFGYFAICVVAIYLGGRVNGISPIGYPLISLFVPLYTGILFFMRGKKEKGIILASLYILMPVLLAVKAGTMTGVVQVILICYSMLCIATAANWFGSDKKKALVILAGEPLFVMTQAGWLLPFLSNGYRLERFKAFFHPEQYQQTFNYLPMKIRDIIASCKLFGKSGDLVTRIPSLNTDYVLLSFFACFGILAGIGVIGLITIFVKRMWVISFQQKNALGFMIGLSISLLMTAQIIIYAVANWGYGLLSQMNLPLLSYGGINCIINFAIIGLILSIYRNTNIIDHKQFHPNVKIPDENQVN